MIVNIRDVAIVILALESIVIGVILLLLLWQVRALVILLKNDIRPILKDAKETTQTVQTTTKFVGKRVARPAVKTMSLLAGVRGAVKSMRAEVSSSDSWRDVMERASSRSREASDE